MNTEPLPKKVLKTRCSHCNTLLKIQLRQPSKARLKVRCPRCGSTFIHTMPHHESFVSLESAEQKLIIRPQTPPIQVFLGTEDLGIAQRLATPLIETFQAEVQIFQNGELLREALNYQPPNILVVEAGLPGIMGYEILDIISQQGVRDRVHTILLGSVSRPYRYHRPPTQHYGADAYIEPNIGIPQFLQIIQSLLYVKPRTPAETSIASPSQAQKLARSLITDLILHNLDRVRAALNDGLLHQVLHREIMEAHQYYIRHVDPALLQEEDFFKKYLDEMQRARKIQIILEDHEP